MNLMSARLDPETGLRNPTITEAQAADRVLMQLVFDLVSERGWNVDDSLYEITNVRAEIHTLLQARPRLPKQNALQHFQATRSKDLAVDHAIRHMSKVVRKASKRAKEKPVGSAKHRSMVFENNYACVFRQVSAICPIANFIMDVDSLCLMVNRA